MFPFLVYDGGDWEKGLRCVACQICEKECPPKCIYIEKSKDKKPDFVGKPQIYPAKFDIDISVCMSCQICVEVCPFEAIKMDNEFELATDDRFGGLLLDGINWRSRTSITTRYTHGSGAGRCETGGREGQGGSESQGGCSGQGESRRGCGDEGCSCKASETGTGTPTSAATTPRQRRTCEGDSSPAPAVPSAAKPETPAKKPAPKPEGGN